MDTFTELPSQVIPNMFRWVMATSVLIQVILAVTSVMVTNLKKDWYMVGLVGSTICLLVTFGIMIVFAIKLQWAIPYRMNDIQWLKNYPADTAIVNVCFILSLVSWKTNSIVMDTK